MSTVPASRKTLYNFVREGQRLLAFFVSSVAAKWSNRAIILLASVDAFCLRILAQSLVRSFIFSTRSNIEG